METSNSKIFDKNRRYCKGNEIKIHQGYKTKNSIFGLKNAIKSQTYACTLADLSGETGEARP